jgi:hypothetical protein
MFVDRASVSTFHMFSLRERPFQMLEITQQITKNQEKKKKSSRRTGNTGKLQHMNPMSDESSQRQGAA